MEIINRKVKSYLQFYCSDYQDNDDELLPYAEFVEISSILEQLGMYQFELHLGWYPNYAIQLENSSGSLVESVQEFKEKLRISLEDAQLLYKGSKGCLVTESSEKYNSLEYSARYELWSNKSLFSNKYSGSQESDKLASR